jgi:N-formylglutamate amidohydrolase
MPCRSLVPRPSSRRCLIGIALPLLFWLPACKPAQPVPAAVPPALAAQLDSLLRIQRGNLPIVISAPHGGNREIPGSSPRTGEGQVKGGTGFSVAYDRGTEELALELAAEVERVTGKKPYLVAASFSRRYLDCNRGPAIAYSDAAAKAVYEVYHGALQAHCKEITAKFGGGLVIDLHGQGSSASTVFRGTKNGASVTAMRKRFGEAIHEGPDSVLGRLKALGWKVHPEPGGKEQAGFSGGFITQTYGGEAASTDAIQLEFGADYRRTEEQRKTTAQALAKVLADLAKLYRP